MLSAGQHVNTKYGRGVVVSAGAANQHVYVRIDSSAQIYILDRSGVFEAEPSPAERATIHNISETDGYNGGEPERARSEADPSIPSTFSEVWRGPMKRGQKKRGRPVEESQLSIFVRARLADLGMKQADFCRLTGFDQGLLSKIQSSMICKLNLETALRLAVGLLVSPRRIFELIGKPEFQTLLTRAYPVEIANNDPGEPQDVLADVIRVSRLALQAHGLRRDLTPAIELLNQTISTEPETESREPEATQEVSTPTDSTAQIEAVSHEEQSAAGAENRKAAGQTNLNEEESVAEEHDFSEGRDIPMERPGVPAQEHGSSMHQRSYGKHNSH